MVQNQMVTHLGFKIWPHELAGNLSVPSGPAEAGALPVTGLCSVSRDEPRVDAC